MRNLLQNQRSGSFQLPRQAVSPTRLSPMEAALHIGSYDSPRDYSDSSGEYKQSTPPPRSSLLHFLREHRSPEIEPRGATAMDGLGAEDASAGGQIRQERVRNAKRKSEVYDEDEEEVPDVEVGGVSKSGGSSTATSSSTVTADAAPANGVKRSRYLREVDRRTIIRRIDSGEKQATLAKEFGVTRAAICHINKNRVEILMRSARADVHSAARHPKRGMYSTSKSSQFHHTVSNGSHGESPTPMVYEVRSAPLAMLLTALRREETVSRNYRLAADRAFRVLLEEAIASAPTHAVEIVTANDSVCHGVVAEDPTCAIVMSECGYPMLEVFRSIQPESPTGFMTLEHEDADTMSDDRASPRVVMRKMCAPPDLRGHSLFLLDATCSSSHEAVVAIQSLVDFGAHESSIFFVALVISARAVTEICDRFPGVHIVTAAIDPEASEPDGIRPGIGNFQERYFNTTTIHQNHFGANVQL